MSIDVRDEWSPLVVRLGCASRPVVMPVDAGWALCRALGAALESISEAPAWALGEVQVGDRPVWWRRWRRGRALSAEVLLTRADVQIARAGRGGRHG